jgi:aromatic amino acid aminotransferase I / 2-aminoadipate transaminase
MAYAGLAIEYRTRRDFFIDTIGEEFHMKQSTAFNPIWTGMDVYECSLKPQGMIEKASYKKMFSFVPPTSGMFVWVCTSYGALHSHTNQDIDCHAL